MRYLQKGCRRQTYHVLSESDLARIHSNFLKEQIDTRQEIAQSLVVNDTILHSLSNRRLFHSCFPRKLRMPIEQVDFDILNLEKPVMLFTTFRVHD